MGLFSKHKDISETKQTQEIKKAAISDVQANNLNQQQVSQQNAEAKAETNFINPFATQQTITQDIQNNIQTNLTTQEENSIQNSSVTSSQVNQSETSINPDLLNQNTEQKSTSESNQNNNIISEISTNEQLSKEEITEMIDETVEKLIEDGRIQPARIEEVYKRVKSEFDANIIKEGQDVIIELGIGEVHPELVELVGKLRYRASYGQNALAHTLEVAYLAGLIASQLGGDVILARRAGLFHDIGKALTHEVKGSHVDIGADLCKKYNENDVVINAIYAHHGYEEPNSVESAAVCAADALSAARPGARREVLEAFLKRVEEIEAIATSHIGVINAYAINAGREVRVIVNAELVNDDEAIYLAQKIASDIEERVQYPGEIKVNVIRELRAIEYAR